MGWAVSEWVVVTRESCLPSLGLVWFGLALLGLAVDS